MSLGLATKGMISDFTGVGGGTTIVYRYTESLLDIELFINDPVDVLADVDLPVIEVSTESIISVDVDLDEGAEVESIENTNVEVET